MACFPPFQSALRETHRYAMLLLLLPPRRCQNAKRSASVRFDIEHHDPVVANRRHRRVIGPLAGNSGRPPKGYRPCTHAQIL
jgi:hypothetical protein